MAEEELTPWKSYFGQSWPSGICEDGIEVPTPVGRLCSWCQEAIVLGDQGTFVGAWDGANEIELAPIHRECSLRSVLGGIGHLEDHEFWCHNMGDPDGGRTKRQSAIEVWDWCLRHGTDAAISVDRTH